ncbi:MAG: phosphatase PAP2 family protein [Sphingobium sp.]
MMIDRYKSRSCPADNGSDDVAWMVLATTLSITLLLQVQDPFTIALPSLIKPAAACLVLGGLGWFYSHRRPASDIAAMLNGLLLMTLFSAVGAMLSYMLAARGGAFWDAQFASWDATLNLDWRRWLALVDRHPWASVSLNIAYRTLIPQMVLLILTLGLCRRQKALRIAILAAMIAGLTIILLSSWMPALGAYVHYGVVSGDHPGLSPAAALVHMPNVAGLREGTMRLLSLDRLEGIITFPSYHGALAVIFCWGFAQAPIPAIRVAGMSVSMLTLIATPIDGGHYFSDVVADALVALSSIPIAARGVHFRLPVRWEAEAAMGHPLPS